MPYAREIAVRMDAELILFQVAIPSYAGVATPDQLAAFSQLGLSAEIGAGEYLQGVEQEVRKSWAKVQSVVGLGAGAAVQILEQAKEKEVDLIAMSTHGRTGISRWVFGSVAAKVLHAAEVPVLLIRARATAKPPT